MIADVKSACMVMSSQQVMLSVLGLCGAAPGGDPLALSHAHQQARHHLLLPAAISPGNPWDEEATAAGLCPVVLR